MIYRIVVGVSYFFFRIMFRMRYEGLENIPQGGYILCANHQTVLDPLFLAHKIPQKIRSMAKVELFKNKLFGWLMLQLGAFPVVRGSGDAEPLDRAIEVVANGGVVMIFPEGHRSKTGEPLRGRSGVAMVAGRSGGNILPCSIDYEGKLKFRREITLRFHPVMSLEELNIDVTVPRTLRMASRRIMEVIVGGLTWKGPNANREGRA